MTRKRRSAFTSRVCIGMFVLLFSNVIADTTKGLPTVLEKTEPAKDDTVRTSNNTISSELPSETQSVFLSPSNEATLEQKGNINNTNTSSGTPISEKKDPEASVAHESQSRSIEEADRLTTFDSKKSRDEDEIPGKSANFSRANDLTAATVKPALADFARQEDERNKTRSYEDVKREEKRNKTTLKSFEEKYEEKRNKTLKEEREEKKNKTLSKTLLENTKETGSKIATQSGLEITEEYSSGEEHKADEHDDRESTTVRTTKLPNDQAGISTKSSNSTSHRSDETLDLQTNGKKGTEQGVSLINDTYVNYNHVYKTADDKRFIDSSTVNNTHFTSEDANAKHEKSGLMEEVEVVKNMTHSPVLRIAIEEKPSVNQSMITKSLVLDNELKNEKSESEKVNVDLLKPNSSDVSRNNVNQKAYEDQENVTRTAITAENVNNNEEQVSTPSNLSQVPRGRTIMFSNVNEFPGLEAKTTTTAPKEVDNEKSMEISFARKNVSLEKTFEKPYPYLKKEPVTEATARSSKNEEEMDSSRSMEETTEETSAYENTIRRGQSEKKFIVTEPSVVIENSIQQSKPEYQKKSENNSINSTTESSVLTTSAFTGLSASPTNVSVIEKPFAEAKTEESESAPSKSTMKNDVPRGKEESKTIIGKDENFDVTGNGITEISTRMAYSSDRRDPYGVSYPEITSNRTTEIPPVRNFTDEKPQTESRVSTNVDVQTDAEESMLLRSTLNVTEGSTELSLTKESSVNDKHLTLVGATNTIASTENITVVPLGISNVTEETKEIESTTTLRSNNTNEVPAATTLAPEENSVPETTTVEYEFVGLTETPVTSHHSTTDETLTDVEGQNTTVPSPVTEAKKTSVPAENESSTVEHVTESQESETVTDREDRISTTPLNEQTSFAVSETETTLKDFLSTGSNAEDQTEESVTENPERSTLESSTSGEIASRTDSSTSSEAKDVPGITNVTETARSSTTESGVITGVTSSRATNTTSTSKPFMPGTLKPRIVTDTWSSTSSTSRYSTTEQTTEPAQTLSPDEITLLVRIVVEGGWNDVCPHLPTLRQLLADILTKGVNKPVVAEQVIFHQNPCREQPLPAASASTDTILTSILVYVVDENGNFNGEMTKILPSLYKVSSINFPVRIHSFLLVQETDSGNAIAVVVVSSVAFICLVLLAGLLFIMRKRQTRFNYGERCRPVSLDAYSLDSVSAYNSVRRKGAARSSKRSYGNPTFEDSSAIPSHPLNFAGLSSFCNDVNAINEEFVGIPQVSAKIDELPPGAEVKNRYANVIPLPETRVPLQRLNNDPLTEYINASYVRGPKNATKYYIACQAPIESTVTDFWRMIWEQQSKVIIMLTDLVENGVEKCTEYIPPSEVTDCHRLYGDFQVTLKKRETKEKYAISTLHLKNLENNTYREVFHIWYLWPVNGVQSDGAGLIAVLLEARALQRGGPGPIVVHCSPGTGRTGTLIALDLGIRQYEITRTVDVPRVVYTIRRDRAGAVQTKEQYAFIYKALNLYATKLAGGVLEST